MLNNLYNEGSGKRETICKVVHFGCINVVQSHRNWYQCEICY